ncbi:four helix bundle protein [Nodosilinea sp. P-1105]|uniref:four helix bundle protein n=1 Tax=Nodosilinea sp. P-1105 TaxID=2546229 RepID=UPI00146A31D6|nr:four helix bundle protein [Nodosilinea sp. P-1105]
MQNFVHSYRDLQVYQLAFEGSVDLYRLIHQFPQGFDTYLAAKLLSTSRAVRANIAAAWGKRRNLAALIGHLSTAQLEAAEMQIWIEAAIAAGYLTAGVGQGLYDRYRCIYVALDQLMASAMATAKRRQGSQGAVWRATA